MSVTTASNFNNGQTMKWAGTDNDPYDRATQMAGPAQNLDEHDHTDGLGLPVGRLQYTTTPDAQGEVQVATDDLKWYGTGASAVQTAVRLAGTQAITGDKTFSGTVAFNGVVTGDAFVESAWYYGQAS
jgi:hypothetical protein